MAQVATQLESLVRSLASSRPERGACISLFVDLDPTDVPTANDLSRHVTSLVDSARRLLGEIPELSHDEETAGREDLERAQAFFDEDFDRSGAAGFALYANALDGLWQELPLTTPVRDSAQVGRRFALAPLLGPLESDREIVLVAVGRERGTIWRSRSGRVELVDDRFQEIGRRHDQGGWSQARLQRSVDEDAYEHFRDVADSLADEIRPGFDTLLLVACVEEQRPRFEEMLAPHVREALLGWTTVEAHAGEDALQPEAERLLGDRLESERAALLERWLEVRGRSDRAVSSWAEALEAAADRAIEAALVDGRSPRAWVCPACDRGSLEPGSCTLDGTPLVEDPGGALENVVRWTLANRGQARLSDAPVGLDGVAGLLRFPVTQN
jgi:peptide chain release factor subunit 1